MEGGIMKPTNSTVQAVLDRYNEELVARDLLSGIKGDQLSQVMSEIDELAHVGVPGMRWGVRKARSSSSDGEGSHKKSESDVSEDYQQAHTNRRKPVHALSNKELQHLTKRMELEKKYRDLNPTDIQRGQKFVKGVIGAGVTVTALHSMTQTAWAQPGVRKASKSIPALKWLVKPVSGAAAAVTP